MSDHYNRPILDFQKMYHPHYIETIDERQWYYRLIKQPGKEMHKATIGGRVDVV